MCAQEPRVRFEHLSIEQGLSESIVTAITQDSRGFMWFGTEDGLNVYDGYSFKIIRNDPENPSSISYNQITTIFEDRTGWLWIGTFNGGLNHHDPHSDVFVRYRSDAQDSLSLSSDIIWSIHEDRQGRLWIGTAQGLNMIVLEPADRKKAQGKAGFIRYTHDPASPFGLSHDEVRAVFEDDDGNLWIGTDGGLNLMADEKTANPDEQRFYCFRHDPDDSSSLSQDTVRVIYQDRTGTLWVGTDGGLNRLVKTGKIDEGRNPDVRFIQYHHDPEDPFSLSHEEIYTIYEDRYGYLWIGTNGGGLDMFDRSSERFVHYQRDFQDASSLSYNEIRSIFEDRSGIIWIGTYGAGINKVDRARKQFSLYRPEPGNPNSLNEEIIWSFCEDHRFLWVGTQNGLNRMDMSTGEWRHYLHDPADPHSLSDNIVRVVFQDRSGRLWIGTEEGLNLMERERGTFIRFQHNPEDSSSISHNQIRDIYEDRMGVLWISTHGGGLNRLIPGSHPAQATFKSYRHDPQNPASISSDFLRGIIEDRKGDFWFGTLGGGLNKFDRQKGSATVYRANAQAAGSLSSDYIFSLYEDRVGHFWIGTFGGGLNKFDRESGTSEYFTQKDGLPNDVIYGILEDNTGNLWLSTNEGLSKFDPKSETFRNYTERDGLQSKEFDGGAFYKSKSGELFFGGIHGFNSFYPENIRDNPYVPPVVITAFHKLNKEVRFDRPISEVRKIRLTHKDYVFSFEFAALDYTAPEMNRYAYKMEGLDKEWIATGANKRYANYTTLSPGVYVFKVIGSNNDGVWNEKGTVVTISIAPAFHQTWFFRFLVLLAFVFSSLLVYRRRVRNVRYKTELQAAHDAQMSIMPHSDPVIKGCDVSGICLPASEVGGDFFDYIWLDEEKTKLGIAVGDVSGKAMKAAMMAIMSSGMVCTWFNGSNSIKDVMGRLNRVLFEKTERQMFTALCLSSIDIPKKTIRFTNAGLNEPLLKTNGSVIYLEGVGHKYPLGSVKQTVYDEKVHPLAAGDVLVFYTDGIPEAKNAAKSFYGYGTLKTVLEKLDTAHLSAKEIKERIIEDVMRFSGNAPRFDDMTVVVFKFNFQPVSATRRKKAV